MERYYMYIHTCIVDRIRIHKWRIVYVVTTFLKYKHANT